MYIHLALSELAKLCAIVTSDLWNVANGKSHVTSFQEYFNNEIMLQASICQVSWHLSDQILYESVNY